jgi:hypothetical protein
VSDTNNDGAEPAAQQGEGFDWKQIAGSNAADQGGARAAAFQSLPPTPPNSGFIAGRLPIQCDTGKAIIQLPEPIKLAHCAVVLPNTGVLSDCYRPAKKVCVPNALRARPLNDREFEVILDGGEHVAKGLGWALSGSYPGALPETRSIDTDVPYVEILALVGVDCGCDSENWASDEWGQ